MRQCATSHVDTHRNRADNSRCSSVGFSGSGWYLTDKTRRVASKGKYFEEASQKGVCNNGTFNPSTMS